MMPRLTVCLVSLALAGSGLAQDKPAPVSEEVESQIRERLPNYDHEAAEAARKRAAEIPVEEDVIVLPEMTVWERQQQKMVDEDLFKKGKFDEKLVKEELSELDRAFLNRYHIPFVGISNKARARQIYLERKNREFREGVQKLAGTLELTDPEEAKRLRAALNGWK